MSPRHMSVQAAHFRFLATGSTLEIALASPTTRRTHEKIGRRHRKKHLLKWTAK